MPEEFAGDLSDAEFWGVDLSRATFRDVNLTGATVSHAWLVDVSVDAYVERLVVNGVDVTDYVNEHDVWFPLRTALRPTDAASMRRGWALLQDAWRAAIERADALPDRAVDESVGGEWSFADTLRHLLLATDKWFTAPVLGGTFHPFGLANRGSVDFPFPGLDPAAAPSFDDVLTARAERSGAVSRYLAGLDDAELDRVVDVLENGPHQVRDCLATVLEEEFWHLRYADRDLRTLEAAAG